MQANLEKTPKSYLYSNDTPINPETELATLAVVHYSPLMQKIHVYSWKNVAQLFNAILQEWNFRLHQLSYVRPLTSESGHFDNLLS